VRNISHDFMEQLIHYSWCGNIRELKNLMERAVIMCDGTDLDPGHLPSDFQRLHNTNSERSSLFLTTVEKKHIQKVLAFTGGNKTEAARLLEIGLATLYRKIEAYELA
jgi:DNA-binding NtrC family response regulator